MLVLCKKMWPKSLKTEKVVLYKYIDDRYCPLVKVNIFWLKDLLISSTIGQSVNMTYERYIRIERYEQDRKSLK